MSTNIEWADETWNPVVGCAPVSEGCANCYAAPMARRLEAMGGVMDCSHHYAGLTTCTGKWTGKIGVAPERVWLKPFCWGKPRRVFVCSMGDLFHEGVSDEHIDQVAATAASCPRHVFMLLTKRAERMRRRMETRADPLPNVWCGVTVENQLRADERREHLAALADCGWMTFVSNEPALGPVNWTGWEFLSWIVAGGESGPKARPSHPDWHRAARGFCAEHGVPFFFKKWGEWMPDFEQGRALSLSDDDPEQSRFQTCVWAPEKGCWEKTNGCWDDNEHWVIANDYLQPEQPMTRVGRRAAGHLLDGREHRERPASETTEAAYVRS